MGTGPTVCWAATVFNCTVVIYHERMSTMNLPLLSVMSTIEAKNSDNLPVKIQTPTEIRQLSDPTYMCPLQQKRRNVGPIRSQFVLHMNV